MMHERPRPRSRRSFVFAALLLVAGAVGYLPSTPAEACTKTSGWCWAGSYYVASCFNGHYPTHAEADTYYSGYCGGVHQYGCYNWRSVSCPPYPGPHCCGGGHSGGWDDGGGGGWDGGGGGGS